MYMSAAINTYRGVAGFYLEIQSLETLINDRPEYIE